MKFKHSLKFKLQTWTTRFCSRHCCNYKTTWAGCDYCPFDAYCGGAPLLSKYSLRCWVAPFFVRAHLGPCPDYKHHKKCDWVVIDPDTNNSLCYMREEDLPMPCLEVDA